MQIILIDEVLNLGKRGDVVKVAAGYGRNYLIPKGLAVTATDGNLKMIQQQRVAMAKQESQFLEEAQILSAELAQLHLLLSRKTGASGSLFGSVTSKDIADLLAANGINLDRRKIMMDQPFKKIGNYEVQVRLHSELTVDILVSVLVEEEEAVSKVLKKGEESDKIRAAVDAKVLEVSPEKSKTSRTEEVAAEPRRDEEEAEDGEES